MDGRGNMNIICNGRLSFCIVISVLMFLTGCTVHITKDLSERLNDKPYKSVNNHPQNLSILSKCQEPPIIKIINGETRIEDYEILVTPPTTRVINPKELMDGITLSLRKGFEQSHIITDDKSAKVLQIKMIDLKLMAGTWLQGAYFKLELNIPETGFTKLYEASDNTRLGYDAPIYAIHTVTRRIIDDPLIQDYILCRNEYNDSTKGQKEGNTASKSLSKKLQDLQTALDNCLITKKEYQLKRKEIIEKY